MMLSAHFSLSELVRSETATRNGIDNTPGDTEIENLIVTCREILEPVREHYGIPFAPNSGYRCLALNRAIGSSDSSQHVTGNAVDFEIPGIDNKEAALWVMENCDFDQLILEFYKEGRPTSGWVHCSYDEEKEHRRSARIFDGSTWSGLA
jgi:zinc D-Ala-D-Ala carboxypeptidase|tara:strand:+ start:1892 stop:2341 length:450 start_codon:yes stop_codon:yes gene_type:complete